MGLSVEANMAQARRWASVALSCLVAASFCLGASGLALAASADTEVLDWKVGGSVEAGGMYSFGERSSSKFKDYRDMDNGFLGELSLKGEKKESPYYFDLWLKNPAKDDQAYEGAIGRYGMFKLDLGWDRVRHVLSNNAQTMFQESGGDFTIGARSSITTTPTTLLYPTATNCSSGAVTSWNCPNPIRSSTAIAVNSAQYNFINSTISGLGRPVDLAYNTDVGFVGLKLTPTEALRFDLEYNNRRNEGYRPTSVTLNNIVELAIPVDQMTHEMKFGAEYAASSFAVQFGYMGSFFDNGYQSYTFDNPNSAVTQQGVLNAANTATTTAASARGEIAAAPNNTAHTFNLTGRGSLPWWRTNLSGNFSYTMLRQDQAFVNNIAAAGTGLTPMNTDDAGRNSADAKANLISGNFLFTARPIDNVTATARYRYFEYQNDTPTHVFSDTISPITPTGLLYRNTATGRVTYDTTATDYASGTTSQEHYTRQNAGADIRWRPIRQVSIKGGYEYEHWSQGDVEGRNFGTDENIAKAAVDVTPIDWFLGRVTYTYGVRNLNGDYSAYGSDPSGPGFYKFNYADRVRNRVDVLLQFSPWETFTPSLSFGYAGDNYSHSMWGLTDDENFSAGTSLSWTPIGWLTLSADYTYERHNSKQSVAGGGSAGSSVNDWQSTSNDVFHIISVGAIVDVIPKKLDINLGYGVTFGYTTIDSSNLVAAGCPAPGTATSCAYNYDKIQNVLQTARIVARYRLTEKLSVRGGFAYERYNERNFARDPMTPFMGAFDSSTSSIQSVWLGATTPNYESYTFAGFVRYEF
jgi:MtrB/PioB family decaheme-associated outer membrane protein